MGIVILTFAGVAALIFGIYWALVIRPESAAETAVKRRLGRGPKLASKAASVFQADKQLSEVPALNALLARSQSVSGRIELMIERSGLKWNVGTVLLASGCLGIGVMLVLQLLGVLLLVAVLLGALAAGAPLMFVRYKAEKRMQRFEELFPEAIGLIVRSLRAGHAFTTGLAMVAEEMGDPVGPEFKSLYDQQNFGMPLEAALKAFATRIPILDAKFFVTAVLTQRDAGGNLAEVLENLTGVVRDRFKVKRQVRVVTAHARFSGAVLIGLPIGLALIMLLISPGHMRLLWTDPIGIRMSAGAIVLQTVGILIIRRLVRIEY